MDDNTLWSWGNNDDGKLGYGIEGRLETPRKIMDNVISAYSGTNHNLLIKKDNTLWGVGSNRYGQLSNVVPYKTDKYMKIMDNVIGAAAGWNHTMVIKSDNSLWGFGFNYYGQIGTGNKTDNTSGIETPRKIMDDVIIVGAGGRHSAALKKDGTLWTWGANEYGQLGDGTFDESLKPKKIMDGVKHISVGHACTMAVKK